MTIGGYAKHNWVNVPAGTTPPVGAVPISADHLGEMDQAIYDHDQALAAGGGTGGGGAGLPSNIVSVSSAYSVPGAGYFVEADTTSAGFTVTLPAAPATGALVAAKKVSIDANTLTIAAGGGGTIDGSATTSTATQWAGVVLEHKGSNVWRVAASMTTTGPQGPQGVQGIQGIQGPTGPTGTLGAAGFCGTGSDGAATFDGSTAVAGFSRSGSTYSATRNVYFTTATVNSGVTVVMSGFILHASVLLTNNGTIHADGASATTSGGAASLAFASITGVGAAGVTSPNSGVGTGGTQASNGIGGTGGAGGTGTAGAGGAGAISNAPAAFQETTQTQFTATTGFTFGNSMLRINGGGSGGSGASTGSLPGGGSGAGGNVLIINARSLVNNGAIRSRGGNGGATTNSGSGGGGGGGGGCVLVNTIIASSGSGTVDANGGTGGTAPAGGGANGSTGTAGAVRLMVWG